MPPHTPCSLSSVFWASPRHALSTARTPQPPRRHTPSRTLTPCPHDCPSARCLRRRHLSASRPLPIYAPNPRGSAARPETHQPVICTTVTRLPCASLLSSSSADTLLLCLSRQSARRPPVHPEAQPVKMLDFHPNPPGPKKQQTMNRLAKPGRGMPVRTSTHTHDSRMRVPVLVARRCDLLSIVRANRAQRS